MTFTTTLQAIAVQALDFQRRGMLGYQSADNRKTEECLYRYNDGRRCAIGAGLPADLKPILGQHEGNIGSSIGVLIKEDAVVIADDYNIHPHNPNAPDSGQIVLMMSSALQFRHDDMMDIDLSPENLQAKEHILLFILGELAAGRRPMNDEISAKAAELSNELELEDA